MRKTMLSAAAGLAALALVAAGSPNDRVTGGGQILVSEDGGAGDTIAFTAQEGRDGVKGQVQYVDREGGTGQGQSVFHGTPTCLVVEGNTATIAGQWRDGGDFEIHVVDNGEGSTADGEDVVIVDNEPTDPNCQEDDGESREPVALARGNAQVHDADE